MPAPDLPKRRQFTAEDCTGAAASAAESDKAMCASVERERASTEGVACQASQEAEAVRPDDSQGHRNRAEQAGLEVVTDVNSKKSVDAVLTYTNTLINVSVYSGESHGKASCEQSPHSVS